MLTNATGLGAPCCHLRARLLPSAPGLPSPRPRLGPAAPAMGPQRALTELAPGNTRLGPAAPAMVDLSSRRWAQHFSARATGGSTVEGPQRALTELAPGNTRLPVASSRADRGVGQEFAHNPGLLCPGLSESAGQHSRPSSLHRGSHGDCELPEACYLSEHGTVVSLKMLGSQSCGNLPPRTFTFTFTFTSPIPARSHGYTRRFISNEVSHYRDTDLAACASVRGGPCR